MSDYENEFNDETESEEEVLDSVEFSERYGFEHDCTCSEDWATGNLGVVAVCYLSMCSDALNHLAEAREAIADKDREIADLRVQLADAS